MNPHERTPLELAWLHVIDGEAQVTAQAIRIGELLSSGKDANEAVAVFYALEGKLHRLCAALKLKQAEAARRHR